MLYYVENVDGAWSYPENIGSVEIASNLGLIFQADFIDVNADGKKKWIVKVFYLNWLRRYICTTLYIDTLILPAIILKIVSFPYFSLRAAWGPAIKISIQQFNVSIYNVISTYLYNAEV